MKLSTTLILSLSTAAFADFYYGVYSGEGEAGGGGVPAQQKYQTGIMMKDGEDICKAKSYPIDLDGKIGGPWWNVCGQDLSSFCGGKKLQLDNSDFCGKNVHNDDGIGKGGRITTGAFYANVIDTGDNNKNVGRCVFELGHRKTCFTNGGYVTQTSIHCYSTAC